MADNTNKVTIDAAWFAELYAKANGGKSGERPCDGCPIVGDLDEMRAECGNLRKERDELKAKLDEFPSRTWCGECNDETKARLAAAERCIGDIEELIGKDLIGDGKPHSMIREIIRAYRAAKEAK